MRITFFSFVLMLACLACGEHKRTPIQLADSKENFGGVAKGDDPSLDNFFQEWLKKAQATDPADGKLGEAKRLLQDWRSSLQRYKSTNESLYEEANGFAREVENETIKKELAQLIAESQARFKTQVTPLQNSVASLEAKQRHVRDFYLKLKIMKSLLMVEKKQKQDLPQDKYSQDIEKKLDEALSDIKALMEK